MLLVFIVVLILHPLQLVAKVLVRQGKYTSIRKITFFKWYDKVLLNRYTKFSWKATRRITNFSDSSILWKYQYIDFTVLENIFRQIYSLLWVFPLATITASIRSGLSKSFFFVWWSLEILSQYYFRLLILGGQKFSEVY